MFTRRILPCALLLLTLTVSGLLTPSESRAYGYVRHWGHHHVVYVYRRPYYRSYYHPVFIVRRHHWRRHNRVAYIYGRPYYRGYRYR
jgi:hypothetical protein